MSDNLESPPRKRRWSTVPTALLGAGAGAALTATALLGVGMASAATGTPEPDSGTDSSVTEAPTPGSSEPGTTLERAERGEHSRGAGGDCDKSSSPEDSGTESGDPRAESTTS